MSINDGGPAFPVSTRVEEGAACYGHQDGPATYQFGGMTLRDYFAAKAMQSIVSVLHVGIKPMSLESVASVAYEIADAMLKAREAAMTTDAQAALAQVREAQAAENERLTADMRQIALLAEWQTTGAPECKSGPLSAKAATGLRRSISEIARRYVNGQPNEVRIKEQR